MSIQLIQQRLDSYDCQSVQEEEFALRQITQEIALCGLSRKGFFQHAAFQGGTCLRIFHRLERYSEDLDFITFEPNTEFSWKVYEKYLVREFEIYGFDISFIERGKADTTVKKAFLKEHSIGYQLDFREITHWKAVKKLSIKLEIDTNPPAGSICTTSYLDFPLSFEVTTQDLPSLFAGKCHALLCRSYVKGRDWYDFCWYVARNTKLNFDLLQSALNQVGPWAEQGNAINLAWVKDRLLEKIQTIDWSKAAQDVSRFLKPREVESLSIWGQPFFNDRVHKFVDANNDA